MKHITNGGRIITAICLAAALALTACAHISPTDQDTIKATSVSAGFKCVLEPAYQCAWTGDGWKAYAACVERIALPCLGEHLVALAPVAVNIGHSAGLFLIGYNPAPNPYLAQAHECIVMLPEPAPGSCPESEGLDVCGARRMAACVDGAALAAAREEAREED